MGTIKTLADVPVLKRPHVHIKNENSLLSKLNKMIKDGKDNLQIVTDFDYTITRQRMDNGTVLSSFGVFRSCPSIPQYYKDEDVRLCKYYQPIETDPNITIEEKTKYMVEWYITANKLLRNLKFPREELVEVAKGMKTCFRDGVKELIDWSEINEVPVLVFSAGLGDAVTIVLQVNDLLLPHVKVVSNFLAMDENNVITGIKGEVIHTLNKNEAAIKNTDYYGLVRDRSNAIVMGDSIGDARMVEGMEHCDVTVKIGFLYHNAQENLSTYMDQFDIVLVDDQTMDIVNSILRLIQ